MNYFFVATVVLFHAAFIYLDDGSGIGRYIQSGCIVYLFFYLVNKRRYFFKKKYRNLNIIVILLAFSIAFSAYTAGGREFMSSEDLASPLLGYMLACSIILLFAFVEYTNEVGKQFIFFSYLYYILTFYIVIADVDLLLHPGTDNFALNAPIVNMMGGKFSLSYKHVFWTMIYIIKCGGFSSTKRFLVIMHFFTTIVAALLVSCVTAIIGVIFVCIILVFRGSLCKKLSQPFFILLMILLFYSFIFLVTYVMMNEDVVYFVENVLGRDATLTGRTEIYQEVIPLFYLLPIWGFGPGNSYRITDSLINAPNTQNGLMELFFNFGYIYVIILFFLIYVIMKKTPKLSSSYPILAYLYFLIIISCIEVSLNNIETYFALLLLFMNSNNKRNKIIPKQMSSCSI